MLKSKIRTDMKKPHTDSLIKSSTLNEDDTDSSEDFDSANELTNEDEPVNFETTEVKSFTTNKHLLELKETLGNS